MDQKIIKDVVAAEEAARNRVAAAEREAIAIRDRARDQAGKIEQDAAQAAENEYGLLVERGEKEGRGIAEKIMARTDAEVAALRARIDSRTKSAVSRIIKKVLA